MARTPRDHVRLAAADGVLVGEQPQPRGRPVITLTIEEIGRGRVRISGESEASNGLDERLYTVLGEEALSLAARSVLPVDEHAKPMRLHLAPPFGDRSAGPLTAVARAARLGRRASIATVEVHAGDSLIGRGALVCVVVPPLPANLRLSQADAG